MLPLMSLINLLFTDIWLNLGKPKIKLFLAQAFAFCGRFDILSSLKVETPFRRLAKAIN